MTQTGFSSPDSLPRSVEYFIYTFDFPKEGQRSAPKWQRFAALTDKELALAQAQLLSETAKYQRIEVKQKSFDQAEHRAVDSTLKVYKAHKKAPAGGASWTGLFAGFFQQR